MRRRLFLKSGLSLASLLAMGPAKVLAEMSFAEKVDNAHVAMLTDNDEFP
ncbi:MAG: hypothetical protein H7326_06835, partial [Bdellovibrionaceae bacterium]|nr:hypothetical protein [Pseudobdellovibrionaceae bacterium]